MSIIKDLSEADIVITIGRDGIKTIKNRFEENAILDLPKILQLLLPYQEKYLHSLLENWINKLKIYNTFS
jgi:hypothetical protein